MLQFAARNPVCRQPQQSGSKLHTPPHIFKAQIPPLPHGKWDVNDVSHFLVRLSLPGENNAWPEGSVEDRRKIFDRHLRWNVGLLYFLQNDEAVPPRFRDEAREWGWCRDEFVDSGGLPEQLYVREARRMLGIALLTERDTDYAREDSRSGLNRNAIAVGDYGPNCHGTAYTGPRFGGKHTGSPPGQHVPMLRFLLLAVLANSPAPLPATEEWQDLFNGKDLAGWRANAMPESFTVMDGAIRAMATKEEWSFVLRGRPEGWRRPFQGL